MERTVFPDTIVHSAYPIDIHNPSGEGTASTFMSKRGTYYSIPYGVLYCPEIRNLLVTGRCVSASFEAQAAIRTTPTVGGLGQAAGIAAALAAQTGMSAADVDISQLRQRLKEQNVYLDEV